MNKNSAYIDDLDRECSLFTSYLIEWDPDRYVLDKYREAHKVSEVFRTSDNRGLDTLLVALALRSGFFTKLVDAYTRVFYPQCLIRKKWILLLAILESYGPSHSYFEAPGNGGMTRLYLRMGSKASAFICLLIISLVTVMPLHVSSVVQTMLYKRSV